MSKLLETSVLIEIANGLPIAPTFFKSFFKSGPSELHPTRRLELSIQKGSTLVAPFSSATAKATPMSRVVSATSTVEIPNIRISMTTLPIHLLERSVGESPYSTVTPSQRADAEAMKNMELMDLYISNNEELQCSQALLTGKVLIIGDDVTAEVDYGRNPLHTFALVGGGLWSDPASKPSEAFDAAAQLIEDNAYLTADTCIMGTTAFRMFVSNPSVLLDLDNRRLDAGVLSVNSPRMPGAVYRGNMYGMAIWTYSKTYSSMPYLTTPSIGVSNPVVGQYMDATKVLFMSSDCDKRLHYAPVLDKKALIALRRFAKVYEQEDPSVEHMLMASAPLAANHNPDGTVLVTVL